MGALQSRDLEYPNLGSLNICWLQAHACMPIWAASQLAVSNDSTCMLYLSEQELLKVGAAKDRNTSSEHPILYIQKWGSG